MSSNTPLGNPGASAADIQETIVRLSDDIGKMADRIGQMADRIGDMADRILETQRIQSENLRLFQENSLEMTRVLNVHLESSQALMTKVIATRPLSIRSLPTKPSRRPTAQRRQTPAAR